MGFLDDRSLRKLFAKDILSRKPIKAEYKRYIGNMPREKMVLSHGKIIMVENPRTGMHGEEKFYDARELQLEKMVLAVQVRSSALAQAAFHPNPHMMQYLDEALEVMYRHMYDRFVSEEAKRIPKDTGNLRRSVLGVLRGGLAGIRSKHSLVMRVGSYLPYSVYVNEMPTYPMGSSPVTKKEKEKVSTKRHKSGTGPHVRHPPMVGYHTRGRKGSPLYDPDALGKFFNWISGPRVYINLSRDAVSAGIRWFYENFGRHNGIDFQTCKGFFVFSPGHYNRFPVTWEER